MPPSNEKSNNIVEKICKCREDRGPPNAMCIKYFFFFHFRVIHIHNFSYCFLWSFPLQSAGVLRLSVVSQSCFGKLHLNMLICWCLLLVACALPSFSFVLSSLFFGGGVCAIGCCTSFCRFSILCTIFCLSTAIMQNMQHNSVSVFLLSTRTTFFFGVSCLAECRKIERWQNVCFRLWQKQIWFYASFGRGRGRSSCRQHLTWIWSHVRIYIFSCRWSTRPNGLIHHLSIDFVWHVATSKCVIGSVRLDCRCVPLFRIKSKVNNSVDLRSMFRPKMVCENVKVMRWQHERCAFDTFN